VRKTKKKKAQRPREYYSIEEVSSSFFRSTILASSWPRLLVEKAMNK